MTRELPDHVRRAFDALDVQYDADDLEHGIGRLHVRAADRRTRRALTVAFAIAAIATAGVVGLQQRTSVPGGEIVLADGTRCTAHDARSHLTLVHEHEDSVLLRVDAGAAHFDVAKQHGRRFEVVCGDTTVRVVGTVFDVARVADSARVTVSEGRVEVARSGTDAIPVAAGESWPPSASAAAAPRTDTNNAITDTGISANGGNMTADNGRPSTAHSSHSHDSSGAHQSGGSQSGASQSGASQSGASQSGSGQSSASRAGSVAWRSLARAGDYGGAFAALHARGSEPPRDSPEDLFLAADSARLSGHPADAVSYLSSIVDRHAEDGRADLAAFTLGRIYLDNLGKPTEAARAFARARRLAPHGELAEDALAREVEAWRRAENIDNVRQRGQEYIGKYPNGQRVDMVRRAMEGR